MSKEKNKLEELEKKYGLNKVAIKDLEIVSTGSILFDRALDCGGYVVGKVIELQGAESSGKSTSTLHAISEFQKKFPNRRVALFDYENSMDFNYAKSLGVDIDSVLVYQPNDLESGLNLIISLVEEEIVSLVIIDSHTAALPSKVIAGEIGDAAVGLSGRLYSTFLGKVKGLLEKHRVTLIGISQMRAAIGNMYGPSETTTSANSWRFYSDTRIKFNKSIDKDGEKNDTTITIIKQKCGKPFGIAKVAINWGEGFDKLGEIIDIAVEKGIISKGGAGWFTIGETKLQGKDKVKEFLKDNPGFEQELRNKILNNE